jgi:hypothetical protein
MNIAATVFKGDVTAAAVSPRLSKKGIAVDQSDRSIGIETKGMPRL